MKTLKILTTVLIAAVSLNAFADGYPDRKTRKAKKAESRMISYPALNWGNPADVQSVDVTALRNTHYLFEAPEMVWGSAEEVNAASIEALKSIPLVAAPEMVWGSPEDTELASVEQLRNAPLISYPEMVWGDPEDVKMLSTEMENNEVKTALCEL
jgi:hypothetical protein